MKSKFLFLQNLANPAFASTGLKVALIVGTVLFTINHGKAFMKGDMSRDRWIAAMLTYCVPYVVNVHGQYTSLLKSQQVSTKS